MAKSAPTEDEMVERTVGGRRKDICPRWISQLSQSQSQSTLHVVVPILMAFLICSVNVSGVNASDLVCLKGAPGFPGATFPSGDIFLKSGDTLEVFCTMNLTHPKANGYNASNIEFSFKKHEIPSELIQTTVINATTAMVRVENMNVSSSKIDCDISKPNGRPIPICENRVEVGWEPLEVENFKCISKNWQRLVCSWNIPHNPIPTTYKIFQLYKGLRICPNGTQTANSCEWGPRTDPQYLQNLKSLTLRLIGTNALKSGVIWDYERDHYSVVVPSAPPHFDAIATSANTIMLNWKFPLFEHFEPGLFHRVNVCAEGGIWCNTLMLKTTMKEEKIYLSKEIEVPFAFFNYSINISMRSQTANDTEEFWSEPAMTSVVTLPTRAENPPKTDIGSFESLITSSIQERDVYIYWEQIPKTQRNGPDFSYEITVFAEEELKADVHPVEVTDSYAKFEKLKLMKSYRFEIRSKNANGTSLQKSEVFVPSQPKAVGEPKGVSKLDFTNGMLEISWQPPKNPSGIVSYTVFKCNSTKPRPYQCKGLLEWETVPVDQTRKTFSNLPHHESSLYQYAVSANTERYSSGMIWATCTLIHDKVPEKLKNVKKLNETKDSITIEWLLDCAYQPGMVKGFKITYCLVDSPSADSCIGNENYTAIEGANKTSYHLKDLEPYSSYMISVSMQTIAGESQKSDPIFERTGEGAPSMPPYTIIDEVSNTTAVIKIEPPQKINGKLTEYIIYYEPISLKEKMKQEKKVMKRNEAASVKLTDLKSNTNYSMVVAACTRIGCSSNSSQIFFMTGIGATNLVTFPTLINRQGSFVLEWKKPIHEGGPIKYFEILLSQNGKAVDKPLQVAYNKDLHVYEKELDFTCDTDANLTAKIRAATIISNGEVILGDWSPEGKYSCAAGAGWFVWFCLALAAIAVLVGMGFGSIKLYHYIKDSSKIEVKLPPGLAVSDLNGFSKQNAKRVRKSSGGDTEPYGKENLTYQLQITSSHTDESKDFFSSDSNPREAEECLGVGGQDNVTELGMGTELTTLSSLKDNCSSECVERGSLTSEDAVFLCETQGLDLQSEDVIVSSEQPAQIIAGNGSRVQTSDEEDLSSNIPNNENAVANKPSVTGSSSTALPHLVNHVTPTFQSCTNYDQNETQNPNFHAGAIWWKATPTSDSDNPSQPILVKSRILPMPELNFERRLSLIHVDSFQRFSPSASNPLLSEMEMGGDIGGDGSGTDDEDQMNPNYKMLGLIANGSAMVIDSDTESEMIQMINPSSMVITIPPTDNYSRSNGLEDPDSPDKHNKSLPNGLMTNGPTYVKWRQLNPGLKNGDSADRSSPYCQVGILLDSS